jgi:hypothetical protein
MKRSVARSSAQCSWFPRVRRPTRRLIVVSAALVVTALLSGSQAAGRPGGKLVPASGVYLGAYVAGWGDQPYDNVRRFETMVGRKLAIDHRYWGWRQKWPSDFERWDVRQGRIPMVSWNYLGVGKLRAITSGRWDRVIRRHARRVRRFGHPLFIRWGYEMNGDWFPWSGYRNGRNPDRFVRSWRRIVRTFRRAGARNAVWVWCPARRSHPDKRWNAMAKYYPGGRYVDWVCTEAYNWGTTKEWSRWHDFSWLVSPVYRRFADRKPMMVGESGSAEQGGSKAAWIGQVGEQMSTTFPNIAAYVWFNTADQDVDWRVNSSQSSLDAYRQLGGRAYFRAMR